MDSNFGGELHDLSVVRFNSFQFPSTPTNIMLSAKESRKARRQAAYMLEHETHRATGMDLLPFSAASWKQEDMWKCLEKNTITIAHGAAGTGKTLVALWYGLKGVADGKYEKVYYVRSDVGCRVPTWTRRSSWRLLLRKFALLLDPCWTTFQ